MNTEIIVNSLALMANTSQLRPTNRGGLRINVNGDDPGDFVIRCGVNERGEQVDEITCARYTPDEPEPKAELRVSSQVLHDVARGVITANSAFSNGAMEIRGDIMFLNGVSTVFLN